MSFPAYQALAQDREAEQAARWRVYRRLVHDAVLNHVKPADVAVTKYADLWRMQPHRLRLALDWLTARGYLIEHARDAHGVRSLTLAYEVVRNGPQKSAA